MSSAAQYVLDTFDRRSATVKSGAFAARDLEAPTLNDETIDRIADEAFLDYDAREATDSKR
jgi:hypothetical protein